MTDLKEGSKRYKALLDEAFDLHLRKNMGYSAQNPDAFANFRLAEGMGLTPVQGVLVRLGDKFARVQSLAKNPENDKVGESMRDTLMDLSAYALIAICLMEEGQRVTFGEAVLSGSEFWAVESFSGVEEFISSLDDNADYSMDDEEPEVGIPDEEMCPNCVTPWKCNGPHEEACCTKDCTSCGEYPELCSECRDNGCVIHADNNPTDKFRAEGVIGITCYNRDGEGKCLGHPVKDSPLIHDDDPEFC